MQKTCGKCGGSINPDKIKLSQTNSSTNAAEKLSQNGKYNQTNRVL
jgi:hypothetical protein